jgi:NTE family protein
MMAGIELEALRKALPVLLGDLDEAAFEAIRPHLKWTWVELAGGEILFREGDASDAFYLVINGRLQASVADPGGEAQVVGEIGRGESVGEMGMFTDKPRIATISALRDALLARVEIATFQEMLRASPALVLGLNRVVIERLRRSNASQKTGQNITNIAVLAVSAGVSAAGLIEPLVAELQRQGKTAHILTSAAIDAAAGRSGAAQAGEEVVQDRRWLATYLDEMEGRYDLVFYQTDATPTAWTRRCLRQADEVLLVASAQAAPGLSEIEEACLRGSLGQGRAPQSLVLLHPSANVALAGTAAFLSVRPGVGQHYHVRAGERADLARLARFLSHEAVGLVLAGGGARGLAHLGVFKALLEAGVPVDAVGGTSIGSVLGACMATGWDWDRIYAENKRQFLSNPTSDFNFLPLVSLLAGRKLERILEKFLGGLDIQDLVLPFFCVSSNYTRACEHLHDRGSLTLALMASMAIPGVFPPVVHGDDLLVDGGVFNNLPVDVMARRGVRTILAVDLRTQDKSRGTLNFAKVPGTWALLTDRLRAKSKRRYPLPSLLTTLMAANTLNSEQKTTAVIHDVDILFRPDVARFGLLEWKSYDRLVDAGYNHAREVIAREWPPVRTAEAASATGRMLDLRREAATPRSAAVVPNS